MKTILILLTALILFSCNDNDNQIIQPITPQTDNPDITYLDLNKDKCNPNGIDTNTAISLINNGFEFTYADYLLLYVVEFKDGTGVYYLDTGYVPQFTECYKKGDSFVFRVCSNEAKWLPQDF